MRNMSLHTGYNVWKRKRIPKCNETLGAMDKCLGRTPNMKVKILENVIYEMMCELTMCGVKIWRMGDGTDDVQGRFCKKVPRIPRSAANGIAEWESTRYKMLHLVVQY
jgi:hypothetical protein